VGFFSGPLSDLATHIQVILLCGFPGYLVLLLKKGNLLYRRIVLAIAADQSWLEAPGTEFLGHP
jgi:hypothetical protein